jgi:hypothetical protein
MQPNLKMKSMLIVPKMHCQKPVSCWHLQMLQSVMVLLSQCEGLKPACASFGVPVDSRISEL